MMEENIIKQLVLYGEQIESGVTDRAPSLELQRMLINIKSYQFIGLGKSNLTYKMLKHYRENKEDIPEVIGNHKDSTVDYILLSAMYSLKFLGGKFNQQIDLMVKLLSKAFDVEEQIYKTKTNL